MPGIEWAWTEHARYTAFIKLIQEGKNATEMALPGWPPATAILSGRLVDMIRWMPGECRLDSAAIRPSVTATCEQLHLTFAGVDLTRTGLVDVVPFQLGKGMGATWKLSVIVLWRSPVFFLAAASEFRLEEDHYADRWLLLTELRHMCDLEE
jgi:hypothetical protein